MKSWQSIINITDFLPRTSIFIYTGFLFAFYPPCGKIWVIISLSKKDIEKIISDTYIKNVFQKNNKIINYYKGSCIFPYIHTSNSDVTCRTIKYK